MESKATEHFHPRWRTWLNNYDEKQGAMRQDANGTAHPIRQAVNDKSEASEMFDDITYNKAGAIVRMLEGLSGPRGIPRRGAEILDRPRLRQHHPGRPLARARSCLG